MTRNEAARAIAEAVILRAVVQGRCDLCGRPWFPESQEHPTDCPLSTYLALTGRADMVQAARDGAVGEGG